LRERQKTCPLTLAIKGAHKGGVKRGSFDGSRLTELSETTKTMGKRNHWQTRLEETCDSEERGLALLESALKGRDAAKRSSSGGTYGGKSHVLLVEGRAWGISCNLGPGEWSPKKSRKGWRDVSQFLGDTSEGKMRGTLRGNRRAGGGELRLSEEGKPRGTLLFDGRRPQFRTG